MYLLSRIPPEVRQRGGARLTQRGKAAEGDDRVYYYWRLLVKQRVYKQNRDLLAQLERVERIEKVEQTVGEVVGDYERLLRGLEDRKVVAKEPEPESETVNNRETEKKKPKTTEGRKEGGKRKVLPDELEGPIGAERAKDKAMDDVTRALEARPSKRRREEADP